jgi:hypothetical protein
VGVVTLFSSRRAGGQGVARTKCSKLKRFKMFPVVLNKSNFKVVHAQFLIQEKLDIFNMPSEIMRALVLFIPKKSFDFLEDLDKEILDKTIIQDIHNLKANFTNQIVDLQKMEDLCKEQLVPFILNNISKRTDQKVFLDIFRNKLLKLNGIDLYDYKYNPLKANAILAVIVNNGLEIQSRTMRWYKTRIGLSGTEKDMKLI